MSVRLLYDGTRFEAAAVERMLEHLETLLLSLISEREWDALDVPLPSAGREGHGAPPHAPPHDARDKFAGDQFSFE
jgi:hypothetical protein